MAANTGFMFGTDVVDYSASNGYNFPAGARVVHHTKREDGEFMIIQYVGDPTNVFANAPNGTLFTDPTNHKTYSKTKLAGTGIDGVIAVNS